MKTTFIIAKDINNKNIQNLINALNKSKIITLEGTGEENEETKQNFSFAQSDLLITDETNMTFVTEMLQLNPYASIVFLAEDKNRAVATINTCQQNGIYKVSYIELSSRSMEQIVTELENASFDGLADSSFESIDGATDMDDIKTDAAFSSENVESQDEPSLEELKENIVEDTQERINKIDDAENAVQDVLKGAVISNQTFEDSTPSANVNRTGTVLDEIRSTNTFTLNTTVFDLSCKTIALVSKKGGTGKSTIAKEMANIYSNLSKPKQKTKKLDVCLLDLDFESGSVRPLLGIEAPTPNIYDWISDIVDRLDNGQTFEQISFSKIDTMNYTKRIPNSNMFAVITNQGTLPIKLMDRLSKYNDNGDIMEKIIKKIIKALKFTFDVVIIDTSSDFSDISKVAMEQANNILYTMVPTVNDLDLFKVFVDELAFFKTISLEKITIVMNKIENQDFLRRADSILDEITYDIYDKKTTSKKARFNIAVEIPYNANFTLVSNAYGFIGRACKPILALCNACLPIFQTSFISKTMSDIRREEQAKLLASKKKAKKKLKSSTPVKTNETMTPDSGDRTDDITSEPIPQVNNLAIEQGSKEELQRKALLYVTSDLSNVSVEDFVMELKKYPSLFYPTKTGFPQIKKRPPKISSHTWKEYCSQLNFEIKKSEKIIKEEIKQKRKQKSKKK